MEKSVEKSQWSISSGKFTCGPICIRLHFCFDWIQIFTFILQHTVKSAESGGQKIGPTEYEYSFCLSQERLRKLQLPQGLLTGFSDSATHYQYLSSSGS